MITLRRLSLIHIFVKYGGHSGAAGFSIKIENIEEFSKKLNEYAKNAMEDSTLVKPVKVDRPLPFYKMCIRDRCYTIL